jgi:thymidylate kinase
MDIKLKSRPFFFYITGCDGTGKTTQADLLMQYLRGLGVRTKHVWLRFPFLFCLPFLAYARLRGHSWHEKYGNIRHGYWDFSHSWLLMRVFPWVLLVDALLYTMVRIYIPLCFGYTIVCERFVLDMLADLMTARQDLDFASSLPGRWFLKLLPKYRHVVFLDLDATVIRKRRQDLIWDRTLEEKLNAYRHLARLYDILTISSETSIEDVSSQIHSHFGLNHAR